MKIQKYSLALFALPLLPRFAYACSVCFGDPESPAVKGMNMAILFLLVIIASVLSGFIALFWHFRKMGRLAMQNNEV